jgi:SAM-dependent methyltransferase
MIGQIKRKTNLILAVEWDNLARYRSEQLNKHEDLSMDYVLIPYILDMMSNTDTSNVVDIGCGTGYATSKFAEKAKKITGIDISKASISEAQYYKNIDFKAFSVEDYARDYPNKYSLGIANMTFMDVVNLEETIESTSMLLQNHAYLIITITHPFFWPFYWNYSKEEWFNYSNEIEIEGFFDISLNKSSMITTHYHRPLELYFKTLLKNSFEIIDVSEPLPSDIVMKKYPSKWKFPRFLGIKVKKL